jgi:hypothetical protein
MKLRTIVLGVTVIAAGIGIIARLEAMKPTPVAPDPVQWATPGSLLGSTARAAVIRAIVAEPAIGLRIGAADCEDGIVAFSFPINTIAGPELALKAYGPPTYKVVDVYRSIAHDDFPYLERVASMFLARIATVWVGTAAVDSYFVRVAFPSKCRVDKDASIDWAMALVEMRAGR